MNSNSDWSGSTNGKRDFHTIIQRYLYPVDKSRINEFGFSAEDEAKASDSEAEHLVEEEVASGDAEDKKEK